MSFRVSTGSRGRRLPGGPVVRWFNKYAMKRIRTKGGRIMGFNALVLKTIGAKSGQERITPLGWFPAKDDDSWLIVASASGSQKNPAWYHNLAAHPDKAEIELNGQWIPVTAEQLEGEERAAAWRELTSAVPRFSQYQERTDREIPLIRLVRRAG